MPQCPPTQQAGVQSQSEKGVWMQEGPWLSGRCGEVPDLKRQRKRSGRGQARVKETRLSLAGTRGWGGGREWSPWRHGSGPGRLAASSV